MLQSRLRQYQLTNNLKNKDLSAILGITEQKIGKILSGKYGGSFAEFEAIVSKISKDPYEEYYYATGKHFSRKAKPENDFETEMLQTIRELMQEVRELKNEIKSMREENKSAQVRLPSKIPEHH